MTLCVVSPTLAFSGDERPVTAKDLVGNTYCWDNGRKGTYGSDGTYSNIQGYHGAWSVPEPGVVLIGQAFFQIEGFAGRSAAGAWVQRPKRGDIYHWATLCR